jgi:hypothetical protein
LTQRTVKYIYIYIYIKEEKLHERFKKLYFTFYKLYNILYLCRKINKKIEIILINN